MHKKGQAAMEFLMTYGWAILAAIIAIGVLAYFGVFSPGKYVTGSAVVNPPFYVNAWNVQADYDNDGTADDAGVQIELRNNGGEDYTISAINVDGDSNSVNVICTWSGSQTISAGDEGSFDVSTCVPSTLTEGNTFKGDVTIQYTKTGSLVVLTSTGTIAEKVTA